MQENLKVPLISVIVPVHNGQDYLKNCIDSILAQTCQPLEIILINDGSADRTGEICRGLEKEHENITVVEREDLGVSEGRNAGLALMRGEYVTFVDADDRIHPRMLEVLYRNLVDTGSDVSGCRFFIWKTEEEWKKGAAANEDDGVRIFTQKQFALEGILKNDTRCWSKLYKRECIQNVRFRKGLSIGEDMLFLIDLLPRVRQSVSTDFAGYGYFQNPHGAMNRRFKPGYMDQITCWELAQDALSEWVTEKKNAAGPDREGSAYAGLAGEKETLSAQEVSFVEETIAARQMTGIMLVVGKIAELPAKERKENRDYVKICHQHVAECLSAGKGMEKLDRGYRCKVKLFAAMPGIYVRLYGALRRLKR